MKETDNNAELFPVVDTAGKVVGAATRGECHGGAMLLHPVVHLHVFNSHGELFLQKRPAWKDIQPGRWDTAVGGHVDLGKVSRPKKMLQVYTKIVFSFSRASGSLLWLFLYVLIPIFCCMCICSGVCI